MRAKLGAVALAGMAIAGGAIAASKQAGPAPIMIAREGSFTAGGKVIGEGNRTLHCDRGFVDYQIPANARKVGLFLWHSSSTQVWQARWDGGEGYQSIFLRRGFPVYLWDGPRVGRANWGCEEYTYKALVGRDQANLWAWRLGGQDGKWFDGVQFPTKDREAAWVQATSARYDEFDTPQNAHLQAEAAAAAIDKIGPVVAVTNSAGGWRALLAALKTGNIKGIVAYETPGYVFPEGEGPQGPEATFGPTHVPLDEFKRLTRIPIQLVFGDNVDKSEMWSGVHKQAEQFVAIANKYGGHAEILDLPKVGLKGNSHIAFADMNNVAVADQLSAFLKKNGLDKR